jgi:multidrug efflux pump subunit AcrB
MSISTPFIRRPIATSLLMAAIFLLGVATYPLLPVASLPAVEFPTLAITATLPGASPDIMASSVAEPLETQLSQVAGLSQMTSQSVLGSTTITTQFDLSRTLDSAAVDVLEAINAAGGQLPKNLPNQPTFRKVNPADPPIFLLSVWSDDLPLTSVDDYAETIVSQQIAQVPGVGQVLVAGAQKPAVRVRIDPGRLAAMGLTLEDVRAALTNATDPSPCWPMTN